MNNRDFFYKDVIQDVMNSMEMDLNVDKHLTERAKSGLSPDLRSMGSTLDKLGSKITTEVFIAWRELLKFSGTSLSITLGQTLEKDEKGYYIKVQVKEGDQTYLIRERSLGFRWFFSFILFTHFRAYREKQKRNALFLLDEPASNLHQTAQSKILSIFKKFPSNQDIIYATHSHHMIDTKWLAATFVVKNEAKEYSDLDVAYNSNMTNITLERYFQFVAKYPKDTDYYRPILDALDYQPSQLELTPELIMLEGKYDFYILKYMYEMEFVKSTICKYLYPGTGKDKLEYIIGLYIGWGKNFVVLLDDDRGGRDTYQRLFKIFGNIIKNRLFTLSEINKDWSGYEMEDTFIKADQSKVINTIYPGNVYFDKNKFNTALQDSLLNNRIIKLQQHTINRFKKIFSFLEKKLDENRNGIKA